MLHVISEGEFEWPKAGYEGSSGKSGQTNLSKARGRVEGPKRDNTTYSILRGESTVSVLSSAPISMWFWSASVIRFT